MLLSPRGASSSTMPALAAADPSPSPCPCEMTFSETSENSGFDATVPEPWTEDPPWLIIPLDGTNTAQVSYDPDSCPEGVTFSIDDPSLAEVDPEAASGSPQIITVSASAVGETTLSAKSGTCSADLRLRIVPRRTIQLHFWWMRDQAGHTTTREDNTPALIAYFDSVFGPQANVYFEAVIEGDVTVPGNLGDPIDVRTNIPPYTFPPYVNWNDIPVTAVTAALLNAVARPSGNDSVNILFVWNILDNLPDGVAFTARKDCVISDATDNRVIAHEIGHALGLSSRGTNPHNWPANNLMFRACLKNGEGSDSVGIRPGGVGGGREKVCE